MRGEREQLEEKLRIMRLSTMCGTREMQERALDNDFATLIRVHEYNLRHPDNPIRRAECIPLVSALAESRAS